MTKPAGPLLIGLAALVSGCAHYRAQPIEPETANSALATPSAASVRKAVSDIHHPLLRPLVVDIDQPLSADAVAVLAVVLNPALRTARDQHGVGAAQVLQAGILPNPQIGASVESPIAGDIEGTTTGFAFSLNWDLNALFTKDARVRAAQREAASIDLGIAWQEWQTAQSAKQGFYRLQGARARLAEGESSAKRIAVIREAVERGLGIGAMTVVDDASSTAAMVDARATVLELTQEVEMQRLSLARIIGLGPDAPLALDHTDWPTQAPSDGDLSVSIEQDRLDLQALRLGYTSQEETLRAAVLAQFPKIGIGLTHARDTGNVQSIAPGVTFDLPLFDRNQGAIAAETATRQRLYDEYIQRVFEARHDLAEAIAEARSTAERVSAMDAAVADLATRADAAAEALQRGHVDLLAVETAQAALAQRRLEAIHLHVRLAELGIAIELAAGRYLQHPGGTPP